MVSHLFYANKMDGFISLMGIRKESSLLFAWSRSCTETGRFGKSKIK